MHTGGLHKRLVAAALLALTAAGCGGGSDHSSTNTAAKKPPTRPEFLQRADAICANGQKEVQAVGVRLFNTGKPTSKRQQLKFVTGTVIPSIERQVEGIKRLTPPRGDEARVKAITDAADAAIVKLKAKPKIMLQPGRPKPLRKTNSLAVAYGLRVCAG